MDEIKENKGEEKVISFSELFRLVKINWILIVIITVFCMICGSFYAFFAKSTSYTASSTVLVYVDSSSTTGNQNTSEYNNFSYASYLAKTYETAMKASEFITEVNKKLTTTGLKVNVGGLKFVTNDQSPVFTIFYTVSSREDLREKVALTLNAYIEEGKSIIDTNSSTYGFLSGNKLSVLAKATPSAVTASSGKTTVLLLSFAVGIVISLLIIFIRYLIDDSIKSKEDLENLTGLTVIAFLEYQPKNVKSAGIASVKGGTSKNV